MVLTEDKIFQTLKTVIDPEIGINIVDLGLIYNLEFEDNNVTVTMTLTTPGCPMHNSITNWVKEALMGIGDNVGAKVNLVWNPPWSPDYMSNDAKKQLGRI